jgi:DNA-binding NarL/FixJ family response regulator
MTEKMNLLLIDNHILLRTGLRSLVSGFDDINVVADGSFDQALELAADYKPDVTLLNLICCHDKRVNDVIEGILSLVPNTRILVMVYLADDHHLSDAFKHGALGCLLGDSTPEDIHQAVRILFNGGSYLPVKVSQRILQGYSNLNVNEPKESDDLSPRQVVVLRLMSQGLTNQKIAEQLKISKRTAEMHIYKIFKKLKVNNRTQAIQAAVRTGILDITHWASYS